MNIIRNMLFAAIIFASAILSASAQNKIATVDVKKLFNGYYKTKLAQSAVDKRRTELTKEVKDMQASLKKAETEHEQLTAQAADPAISADERDKRKLAAIEKAKEISSIRGAIDQFRRQGEQQLNDQVSRMSANVLTDIQKAVADKSKTGGYSIVLNVNAIESVVYAGPETDITTDVLNHLNAAAPTDLTLPTGTLPPTTNISTNL